MITLNRADFIDLLRRTMDEEGWLQPILDHPDSRITLEAYIDEFVRVSEAANRACNTGLISTAPGGVVGVTTITVSKAGGAGGNLFAGVTQFVDSRGYLYNLIASLAIPAGPFSTSLVIATLRQTELVNTVDEPDIRFSPAYNVADATNATPIVIKTSSPHTYATGAIVRVVGVEGNEAANGVFTITVIDGSHFSLNGSVGSGVFDGVDGVVEPAPFGLVIDSTVPVMGGLSDYLSVLAAERGILRQAGEEVGAFRQRVMSFPDAITPSAISEVVQGIAQTRKLLDPKIYEPFNLGETPALKIEKILYSLGKGFFDSSFLDDPLFGIHLGYREARAYFLITARAPASPSNPGTYFDSDGFFDGNMFFDASTQAELVTGFNSMRQGVDVRRAHGEQFDIELAGVINRKDGIGDTTLAGIPEKVWELSPPLGKAWSLWHMITGISAPNLPTTTYAQFVRFTFDDATTFDTPTQTMPPAVGEDLFDVNRLGLIGFPFKPITKVEGFAKDDTVSTVRMVSHLWVVEFVL